MKKALIAVLVTVALSTTIAGCANKKNESTTGTTNTTETTELTEKTETSAKEEVAETTDSSKKIKIELMQGAWIGTPRGDDDPYKKWLDETFNVDFVLNPVQNFTDQIMVRFSSDDHPDMISYSDKNLMFNIYNQGVLLSDWNKYSEKVPTVFNGLSEQQIKALSTDGKLIALSAPSNPANWSFKIRKDWLTNLGIEVPKTPEELLEVARKFTQNDPDKNGKNDTYAFTSAGGKTAIGEIGNLVNMWGPSGYYLGSDNKASHPIIDGNWQKTLDFVRILVEEKLIDPDWFTISWNDRKPKLFKGTYGIAWYPGVLANETENGSGNTGATVDWWQTMAMPKGSDNGGKILAGGLFNSLRTVTAAAEKDPEKMDRILQIIESTAYPNDGYWKQRWGIDIDGFKVQDAGDGYKFINVTGKEGVNKRGYYNGGNLGLYDWGFSIATRGDLVIEGSTDTLAGATKTELEMDKACAQLPTYGSEGQIITLDAKILDELSKLQAEFDYKYIMGQENDFDAFKEKWLKAGGQQLLDDATKQFAELGLTK